VSRIRCQGLTVLGTRLWDDTAALYLLEPQDFAAHRCQGLIEGLIEEILGRLREGRLEACSKRFRMSSSSPRRLLAAPFGGTSGLPSHGSRWSGPPIGRTAVKERCRRGYPATKGSPGGKLPAGNGALRSPAFNASAAVRKSETNQE
jgi:hypothetical protein